MKRRLLSTFLLTASLFLTSSKLQGQQDNSAVDFLPASTIAILEVRKPAEFIEEIQNHIVLEKSLELKPAKDFFRSPQGAMVKLAQGIFEAQIGQTIWEALKENTSEGIWFGFDPEHQGAIVAFKSSDEDRLKRVAGQALKLISQQAKQDGKKQPFKKIEYRDAVAAEFEGLMIARCKSWFFVTNKPKLAKQTVDNLIDGTDSNLASETWYQAASQRDRTSDIWGAVNLDKVRELADGKPPFEGTTDNPGVELIFGGILDVLKHSPVAYLNFDIESDFRFELSAPFKSEWANEHREFFFGKELSGLAPSRLSPKNLISSLTSYRDVGEWWLSKEELYPENVIAQLAQTDGQLSTIFSGLNFGEDVLGSLQPGVQLLVTENNYDEKYTPDLKLPAFALVGKLKDSPSIQRRMRIAFQSVIGFANINLGMNGQPQLEVETEKIGETRISAAKYFYEEGTEEGLILFNFEPTVAFHGEHLIISSTRDLAVELAQLVEKDKSQGNEDSNTKLTIDGEMFLRALSMNKESLIAQNMLEEGNDRKEAEQQIDIVLAVAELFRDLQVDFGVTEEKVNLKLDLRFVDGSSEVEK